MPHEGIAKLRNDLAHGGVGEPLAAMPLVGPYVKKVRDALSKMPWLSSLEFIAKDDGKELLLKGPCPCSSEVSHPPKDQAGMEVVVRRGSATYTIWPIFSCVIPQDEQELVPSIYVRTNDNRLEHLPIRNAFRMEFLRGRASKRFEKLFRLGDKDKLLGRLSGFDVEFKENADQVIGRDSENKQLLELIQKVTRPGLIWITGKPGIGKSALLSKVAISLTGIGKDQIFMWRFQRGDSRCTRIHFLRHALQQLKSAEQADADDPEVLLSKLREILMTRSDKGFIFIVDGLDEIEKVDPNFVKLPLHSLGPRILWVCAGQPTTGIMASASSSNLCHIAFPGEGLNALTESEVAIWLRTNIPEEQRAILIREDERWLSTVMKRSEGLPLYIHFLVEDLKSGRMYVNAPLPKGLYEYYDRLFNDFSIDDTASILPKILAAVAVFFESPSVSLLCALLAHSGDLMPSETTNGDELVHASLDRGRCFFRVELDSDGKEIIYPSADSLREHILSSAKIRNTVKAIRHHVHELCTDPSMCEDPEARRTLLMIGINQLLRDGAADQALETLSDVNYLMSRLALGSNEKGLSNREVISGLISDIHSLLLQMNNENMARLLGLLRRCHHQLVRGGQTMLFQLLVKEGSYWSNAAKKWAIETSFQPDWLELLSATSLTEAPFLTIELPESAAALAFHPDTGQLIALHEKSDATLWDIGTGAQIGILAGCCGIAARFDLHGNLIVNHPGNLERWEVDTNGAATCIEIVPLPGRVLDIRDVLNNSGIAIVRSEQRILTVDLESHQVLGEFRIEGDMNGAFLPLPGDRGLAADNSYMNFQYLYTLGTAPIKLGKYFPVNGTLDWKTNTFWTIHQGSLIALDLDSFDVVDCIPSQTESIIAIPLDIATSLKAQILVAGTFDELLVFDLANRKSAVIPAVGRAEQVAVSSDGSRCALTTNERSDTVQIFNLESIFTNSSHNISIGQEYRGPVRTLSIDSETGIVLCIWVNGEAAKYNHTTGVRINDLRRLWSTDSDPDPDLIAISPDGKHLAWARENGWEPKELDVQTGNSHWLDLPDDMEKPLEELGYSKDSNRVWARTIDGRIIEWTAGSGRLVDDNATDSPVSHPRVGDRVIWFDPDPKPPRSGINIRNAPHIEVLELEVVEIEEIDQGFLLPKKLRRICSVRWDHDCPLTATAATLDGRVVIGDEQGRVFFLRRRRGVPFEPELIT